MTVHKDAAAGLRDRHSRPRRLRCALKPKQCRLIEQLRRKRRPYREIAARVRGLHAYSPTTSATNGMASGALVSTSASSIVYPPLSPANQRQGGAFHSTALREWAYVRSYSNTYERAKAWLSWLHRYNWHRPHASLDCQPHIRRLGHSVNNLSALHT